MTHIKTLDELRKEIVKILDLETDPNGEEEVLLIRDVDGEITEGISMSDEVTEILNVIKERDEELRKEIEGLSVDEKFDDRYKLGFYGATIQVLSILKQENDKR